MLVRCRGGRRLFRQADGAAEATAHRRGAARSGRRRFGPHGISGCAMQPRSGLRRSIGRDIRIIDYYEAPASISAHYVRELKARPYVYAGHIVPHDAQARELGTGKSRIEVIASLGSRTCRLPQRIVSRTASRRCACFCRNAGSMPQKCARGIDALKLYRAEMTRGARTPGTVLKPQPVHDWTSHAADAFRYLAMTLDRQAMQGGFYRRIEAATEGVV